MQDRAADTDYNPKYEGKLKKSGAESMFPNYHPVQETQKLKKSLKKLRRREVLLQHLADFQLKTCCCSTSCCCCCRRHQDDDASGNPRGNKVGGGGEDHADAVGRNKEDSRTPRFSKMDVVSCLVFQSVTHGVSIGVQGPSSAASVGKLWGFFAGEDDCSGSLKVV